MAASRIVKLRNIKRALSLGTLKDENTSFILGGRIGAFRAYKSFNFIDLIDGSSRDHIQVIVKRNLLDKPELGGYAVFLGSLVSSKGQKQSVEFKVDEVKFLSKCDPTEYPLATGIEQSDNWYRRMTHLRPRASHFMSLLRVRSELELALHMIMKQMDFFRVHPPILTSNDSEASSDLFLVKRAKLSANPASEANSSHLLPSSLDGKQRVNEDSSVYVDEDGPVDSVETDRMNSRLQSQDITGSQRSLRDYFQKDVFLITSAQLHLENLAASLSRVYSLSSCFRAENSISSRHLCEFQMFELEEANITELKPLMNRVETIVKFIAQYLIEISDHKEDFSFLLGRNKNEHIFRKLAESSFITMSYEEAMRILASRTDFSGDTSQGADLGRLHEKKLLEHTDNVPIFITTYPQTLKPFYMKTDNHHKALCFDLIAPHGGEICGGSLREESLEKLQSHLKPMVLTPSEASNFNWYLDSRRFGSFPHGGFGLGVERFLQTLLGIRNIKDTIAFPRSAGQCVG